MCWVILKKSYLIPDSFGSKEIKSVEAEVYVRFTQFLEGERENLKSWEEKESDGEGKKKTEHFPSEFRFQKQGANP